MENLDNLDTSIQKIWILLNNPNASKRDIIELYAELSILLSMKYDLLDQIKDKMRKREISSYDSYGISSYGSYFNT